MNKNCNDNSKQNILNYFLKKFKYFFQSFWNYCAQKAFTFR